jgi:serine/threonine-protein phosphatase 2A regulatory subunit A
LLAVESVGAFATALGADASRASLLPVVQKFAQDKSWRVRYNVATQLVSLCEALGPEATRADIAPAYVKLLRDPEAEVRIAAAGKVAAFCRMLTPQIIVSQV